MSSYDLLVRSREDWIVGRWSSLRLLTINDIESHPARADIVMFIATAWQQVNESDSVRLYVSYALDWGCSVHVVSQFLVAGVFNTLGCAQALQSRAVNPLYTFKQAVDVEGFSDLDMLALADLRMRQQLKAEQSSDLPFYFPSLADDVRVKTIPAVKSVFSCATNGSQHQLIVMGMHRSGTSCVTNLLRNMGAYFGDESSSTGQNEENPRGFWERRDMRNITDKLLFSIGADWWKVADFDLGKISDSVKKSALDDFGHVLDDLAKRPIWVLKEPRISLLFPVLRPRLQNPIAVCVYRDPLEVALSLQARNGFPLVFGLALWECYTLFMLTNTSNLNRVFISYNKLMNDPIESVEQLRRACAEFDVSLSLPSEGQIFELLDSSLHRNKVNTHSVSKLLTVSQYNLQKNIELGVFGEGCDLSTVNYEFLRFFETNFSLKRV